MIIGVDVDGVLAIFAEAFSKVLIEVTGKDLFPSHPYQPPCWDWCEPLGYTKEEEGKAWAAVAADPYFWRKLKPYPETQGVIDRLCTLQKLGHDVYYITNRPGVRPKEQTEYWLNNLYPVLFPPPTVLVSSQKGMCCSALKVDAYIDDKPSNCRDVIKHMGLSTKVFIMDRPWNQEENYKYIHRVSSVHEMLNMVLPVQEGALAKS